MGVEMVDMWKGGFRDFHEAAENHFRTDLVKMQEPQEDRHFHTSMAIFTAMQSGLTVNIANEAIFKPDACRNLSSGQASAVGWHRSPRRPSQQGLADRLHRNKFEDAAFRPSHPVSSEIPAVDQRRHAHRDDEPRRTSSEELLLRSHARGTRGRRPGA